MATKTLLTPGTLADGLYEVRTARFCAGFVVEHGRVTRCAPILRRELRHWLTQARMTHDGDNRPLLPAGRVCRVQDGSTIGVGVR